MLKETVQKNWWNLNSSEVLVSFNSSHDGLSQEEALKRLAQFGPNELIEKEKISPWKIFLEQFKSILIIILLIAIVLSAIVGDIKESIVIAIIVLMASGLGFIQEYRAERAIETLKKMAAPLASVIRDGRETEIPARELVPGDIILLRAGNRVPADGRLIEAINLKIDEASLTGESIPIEKTVEPIEGEVEVGDRRNMAFMGTMVVYGRGKALVTATGMATEFGRIAGLLQEVKSERTPLQVNLDRLGKLIGLGALTLCIILALLGVIRGHGVLEMLIWGVSLAVAAVPEALPAVVVIGLAIGVRRMAKRNALIRKLSAVETLGCTTFICSDKTGTLTQDQMTVRQIYISNQMIEVTGAGYEPKGQFCINNQIISPENNPTLRRLLHIGVLCNDASLYKDDSKWNIKGDPTEGALVVVAAKANLSIEELRSHYPRVGEIPFTSERKRMTTLHETSEGKIAYSKGAPEIILASCSHILKDGEEKPLSDEDKQNLISLTHDMASKALRVLGFAYKKLQPAEFPLFSPLNSLDSEISNLERDMVFVGFVGLMDPPRNEAKEAVNLCQQAGIKSVMITGDHKLTAVAIARELGILKDGLALTGTELDKLSDDQLESLVEQIEVYARVSPAHKLRVVEALTKKGHVVAMTGDGINDAPALKKADIGVAMGITGTDVTKEAADMILLDDNFASIVAAVEEGRAVFSNIKKYLMYLLSSNLGEILLMAVAILFGPWLGLPYGAIPLVAIQILFVNLVTDGLPAIALAVDPPDPDIMRQKPRPRGQGIFTKPVTFLIFIGGLWSALINVWIFKWALDSGRSMWEAQGLCFVSLIIIQFFKAYNFRSEKHSVFKIGLFTNKWLNLAIIGEILLLLIITYWPSLHEPFRTFSLSLNDWLRVIILSGTIFPVMEISKAFIRKLG
ncbi:MAG: cation-translocating P-type ATPase [Candidatus Aminicenantes bacterium]|nr:cation-translocating P-type ATPase [Candidatus Aminicenantes bacterium]